MAFSPGDLLCEAISFLLASDTELQIGKSLEAAIWRDDETIAAGDKLMKNSSGVLEALEDLCIFRGTRSRLKERDYKDYAKNNM